MGIMKGDYIGFSFNGIHSSDMGVIRTSDGSRFNESLLPTFADSTATVTGGDGTYYFSSNYTQKAFSVPIAFDGLSEYQFRQLRIWLGDKEVHDLIFDELPYKAYSAKLSTSNATLKYLCFDEDGARVYKGEGTLSFVCYYPYAKSVYKYASDYASFDNLSEWLTSSGIENQTVDGVTRDVLIDNEVALYNCGDMETDLKIRIPFVGGELPGYTFVIEEDSSYQIALGAISSLDSDYGICINSKNHLIEGYGSGGSLTGNVYNQYIESGDFFKVPLGNSTIKVTGEITSGSDYPWEIVYDYLYY